MQKRLIAYPTLETFDLLNQIKTKKWSVLGHYYKVLLYYYKGSLLGHNENWTAFIRDARDHRVMMTTLWGLGINK